MSRQLKSNPVKRLDFLKTQTGRTMGNEYETIRRRRNKGGEQEGAERWIVTDQ